MKEEKKKENKEINEEELLKKVEKAAKRGSAAASFRNILLQALPTLLAIGLLAWFIVPKINAISDGLNGFFHFDEPVEGHDMTIDNDSIFGYTAADFEEAILGDGSQLQKLEVYTQKVSDVSVITDTGLLNWGIFTKNQLITFNGTAVYTVDLSNLKKSDISYNEEEKLITLKIPHAVQEEINIPEEEIQFSDTNKGLLAFGDIKMTVEQAMKVQAEARKKMEEKLALDNVLQTADRFAKLSVWEIYSPIIKSVAKDYTLEVVFR